MTTLPNITIYNNDLYIEKQTFLSISVKMMFNNMILIL